MAFNMSAFLGGAAMGVVDRIEDIERKAEKESDRAYGRDEKDRLYNRAKREKEKAITDELADSLSVYYTPDQVADIMKNGKGASRHAISRGEYYTNNNMDASVAYQMPDNDITNVSASAVGSVGDVAAASEALSTGAPEGLGGRSGSFASRFTKGPDPKDKSLAAAETDILNMRVQAATLSEEAGAKLLEKADTKENILLDMQRKKADAAREASNENEVKEHYTVNEREGKIKNYRVLARNSMEIQTGSLGEITGKLKGTNSLGLAELATANNLQGNNNVGYKEVQMDKEIQSVQANGVAMLNQYAVSNYATVPAAKIFQSNQDLQNAARSGGSLKPGDLYITYVQQQTRSDGTVVPAQYMAGTYLGDMYKNLGIKPFLPASYLGETWTPTETP